MQKWLLHSGWFVTGVAKRCTHIGITPPPIRQHVEDLLAAIPIFLAVLHRDLIFRFRNLLFGVGWPIVQNVANLAGMLFVVHLIQGEATVLPANFQPSVFAGLCAYQFLVRSMLRGGTSLRDHGFLASRAYFPRFILPAAFTVSGVVDLLICLAVLGSFSTFAGSVNSVALLMVPWAVASLVFGAVGMAAWFCVLDCMYRDFRYVLPFAAQIGLFLSPVFFSFDRLSKPVQYWARFHPFAAPIEIFRWAFTEGAPPGLDLVFCSCLASWVLFFSAGRFFQLREHVLGEQI